MSRDGSPGPHGQKTPGDHVARLHLFDDGRYGRGGGVLRWLGRHPGLLVFILLAVAAPFVYRVVRTAAADLPAEPAPEALAAPATPEESPSYRAGLTPLPQAELSAPIGGTQAITVRAIGADGLPITGAPVRFVLSQGLGELDVDSVATDGAGLARTTLALPDRPGRVVVVAGLIGSDLPGTTFAVEARAGSPQGVAIVAGNRQEAPAGELLPERLSVRVTDAVGNPVPDVEVRFRIVSGAGMVAPSRIRTDSTGEAAALWRLGTTPGQQQVAALAPDADTEFLTFTATARGDAPVPEDLSVRETEGGVSPVPEETPSEAPVASGATDAPEGESAEEAPTAEPIYVVPQSFAVGGSFVCAIPGGDLSCRGSDDRGQRASRAGGGLTALAAGLSHACVLSGAGEAFCWGANESGQLGDESRTDRASPVPVSTELHFSTLVAGASHTCGLAAGGRALCWGKNLNGQIGDGSREDRTAPRRATTGQTFIRLVAGWNHTCGRSASGETYCWGLNDHGQLGDGTRLDRLTPTRVSGTFQSLVAGSAHTCGIRGDQVLCWGQNGFGQLGDGTTEDRTVPTPVQGLSGTPARLAAGAVSTCALMGDGTAYCWGQNLHGQLGDGSTTNRAQPSPVAGGHAFRSIYAGGALTCGFADDGLDYCWGLNQSGQLGDGTRVSRSVPTRVGG